MPSYYKMHLDETLRKPIYEGQIPDLGFLNYVSTTAQDGWNVGDAVLLPDNREFRHALSDGAGVIEPDQGCHFTDTGYISYTTFAVTAAAGSREITIPAATHAALTTDYLKGGYVIIFNGSADDDVTYGITANDSADANAAFKVRLERPVNPAVTASSAAEVYINPYSAISQATSAVLPWCGCAVRKVSAAANYFWVQTKGIKYCSPQSGVGADNGGLIVHWRNDGSLQKGETALGATVPAADTNQVAGVVIAGSQSGNGPLVNFTGM
jgi:hypothetical protein